MTAEYWTASSDVRELSADGFEQHLGRFPVMRLPAGTIHAYAEGHAVTVCGLSLARLTMWPEMQFPVLAYPNKCECCESLADPVVVNTRWRNTYLAA